MRVIRSNERDLTTNELKAAIAHAQASLTEHAKHGHLDQAPCCIRDPRQPAARSR